MSAPKSRAMLHLTVHEGDQIRALSIADKPRITIGRQETCDLVLQSKSACRIHATLLRSPGAFGYALVDTSTGGDTLLNGAPVSSADIKIGDEIRIGECRIRILGAPAKLGEAVASPSIPNAAMAEPGSIPAAPSVPAAPSIPAAPPIPAARAIAADPKPAEMVLLPDTDGGLLAAKVAPVIWSATSDEMSSEPRTGEVSVSGVGEPLALGAEDEPVFLLTVKKEKPKTKARVIKERAPKKSRDR